MLQGLYRLLDKTNFEFGYIITLSPGRLNFEEPPEDGDHVILEHSESDVHVLALLEDDEIINGL